MFLINILDFTRFIYIFTLVYITIREKNECTVVCIIYFLSTPPQIPKPSTSLTHKERKKDVNNKQYQYINRDIQSIEKMT